MPHTARRSSVTVTFALFALILSLGAGCPADIVLPGFLQPTPIWANLSTDNYWEVGAEGTAAANVHEATGSVAYEWSITSPATLIGSDHDVVAKFTATQPCSATLALIATDSGTGTTTTTTAWLEFTEPTDQTTRPLAADAGEDISVTVGDTVLLLGSWSGGDPYGPGYVGYAWRQASGPAQTIVSSEDVLGRAVTVVGTTPGTAVFEFTVWDYMDQAATDTVTVTVAP